MDVFDLQAKLSLNTEDYDSSLSEAGESASSFGSVFKANLASDLVSKGFGAIVSGAKAAVTGFGNLTKGAVESYSSYEQLTGGVNTLFGAQDMSLKEYAKSQGISVREAKKQYNTLIGAQNKVVSNAENAWKTSGMSANDYMETATSFSASLIQSLGGDTDKAADVADRAIRDMSDNANKMGTDIGSIQFAYQGFAKQNYTMLDNLKLGYGGTKEEMQRLIKDASQMTDVQKKLGITVDESDMSFANIANAISVVQSNMGITGTTTREAMTTIEGSANATKSAWENVKTAIAGGGDIGQAIDGLATALFGDKEGEGLINQVIPRVSAAMQGIADFVGKAAPIISKKLPVLMKELGPSIKGIAKSVGQILTVVLPTLIKTLAPVVKEIVGELITVVTDALGEQGGLLGALANVITFVRDHGNEILAVVGGIISAILAYGMATKVLSFISIIQQVIGAIQAGTPVFSALNAVMSANPIALVVAAIAGLVVAFVVLWNKSEAFRDFWIGLWEGIKNVATTVWNTITGLFTGEISVKEIATGAWDKAKDIAGEIWGAIKGFFESAAPVVKEIATTAWDNAKTAASHAWDAIKGFFTSAAPVVKKIATTAWDNAKSAAKTAWSGIKGFFEGAAPVVKKIATTAWDNAKTAAGKAWTAIKNFFESAAPVVKKIATTAWDNAKTAASNAWTAIKGFFEGTAPKIKSISTDAFDKVSSAAKRVTEKVSGFFSGLHLNIPKPKLPHISVSGGQAPFGIGGKGSLPHFSVEWYAKAMDNPMILDNATIFGQSGNMLLGGGEKGQEIIYGRKALINDIETAVRNSGGTGFVQNLTINSPQALTPSEIARQTRNANRQMILQLRTA